MNNYSGNSPQKYCDNRCYRMPYLCLYSLKHFALNVIKWYNINKQATWSTKISVLEYIISRIRSYSYTNVQRPTNNREICLIQYVSIQMCCYYKYKYISLLIISCIIEYVMNKRTLNLEHTLNFTLSF